MYLPPNTLNLSFFLQNLNVSHDQQNVNISFQMMTFSLLWRENLSKPTSPYVKIKLHPPLRSSGTNDIIFVAFHYKHPDCCEINRIKWKKKKHLHRTCLTWWTKKKKLTISVIKKHISILKLITGFSNVICQ